MDPHERSLTRAYNKAVGAFRRIPKGDPRHARAAAQVLYWQRALTRYQHSRNN